MIGMSASSTALDLCELIDRLIRFGGISRGFGTGYQLFEAARDAGLVGATESGVVGMWVGELVDDGLVTHQGRVGGSPPVPRGVIWGDRELQEHSGYRVTAEGRAEADRTRRLRRELYAERVLAGQLALDGDALVDPEGRAAIVGHADAMQRALAEERWSECVSAAKNLVESAAKAVLSARGEPPPAGGVKLSGVYRDALGAGDDDAAGWTLTRGLVGLVQGLAELRNSMGAGHGHAEARDAGRAEGELAAGAAVILARHVVRGGGTTG
jgi:hypothetical protein